MSLELNRRALLSIAPFLSFLPVAGASERVDIKRSEVKRKMGNLIYIWGDGGGPSLPDFTDPTNVSPNIDVPFEAVQTSRRGLYLGKPFEALATQMNIVTVIQTRKATDLNHDTGIADGMQRNRLTGNTLLTPLAKRSGSSIAFGEVPNVMNLADYHNLSFSVGSATRFPFNKQTGIYDMPSTNAAEPELAAKRLELLHTLNLASPAPVEGINAEEWDQLVDKAGEIVRSTLQGCGGLPQKDLLRYSNNQVPNPSSQIFLVARELIRRGIAKIVLIRVGHHSGYGTFDMHDHLTPKLQEAGPAFAHPFAQLIQDCEDGILEDASIVFNSEFGRTNKLNPNAGRDHSPYHPSILYGPNVNKGSVIGELDARGAPLTPPVSNEAFAKIVHHMMTVDLPKEELQTLPKGIFR